MLRYVSFLNRRPFFSLTGDPSATLKKGQALVSCKSIHTWYFRSTLSPEDLPREEVCTPMLPSISFHVLSLFHIISTFETDPFTQFARKTLPCNSSFPVSGFHYHQVAVHITAMMICHLYRRCIQSSPTFHEHHCRPLTKSGAQGLTSYTHDEPSQTNCPKPFSGSQRKLSCYAP